MSTGGLLRFAVLVLFLSGTATDYVSAQSVSKIDSMKQLLRMEKDERKIGYLYYRLADKQDENDPQNAIPYADSAIMMGVKLKDTVLIVDGHVAKGIALDNLGEYAEALICQTRALELSQAIGNELLAASCYTNIGMLYSHQGNQPERVKENFRKSMQIREKYRHELLPSSYLNMSTAFSDVNYDSARYYVNKCIEAIADTTDQRLLAYAYNTMGSIYFAEEDYTNAILYFEKGRQIKEDLNDRRGLVSAYANIGESYAMLKQYDKAIESLNIALALATALHNKFFLREVYFTLSDVYKRKGDYRNAYEMFQLHTLYRDSIFSDQKSREILDLQEKYEASKKQRENELLKSTNDIQAESIRRKDLLNYSIIACLLLAVAGGAYTLYAYRQKQKANLEISRQKKELEVRNKEVFDSITYAKRIQYTLLANEDLMKTNLPECFIFFKPKDIVSGDFYWAMQADNNSFYLAVCDSTGHGVPGAFMSLLNSSFLNEAIAEKKIAQPGHILDYVRTRLQTSVSKDGAQDGMDCTLMRFDGQTITYAAANNNPVRIRDGVLEELPADKLAVGAGSSGAFTEHIIAAQRGDLICMLTDGYADQFGGAKGKKFKYKQLYAMLEANAHLPMTEIRDLLSTTFETWRGNLEQVDDVCIIGFRVQ
jgi:serine phosphatase RsbU (regulator of sigma subunit)